MRSHESLLEQRVVIQAHLGVTASQIGPLEVRRLAPGGGGRDVPVEPESRPLLDYRGPGARAPAGPIVAHGRSCSP